MNRITVTSKVNSHGVLELSLPVGADSADQDVQVTIEPIAPAALSPERCRQRILETAGKWQGDFERPGQSIDAGHTQHGRV